MSFVPPQPDQVNAANSSTTALISLAVTGASYSGSSLILTGAWAGGGSGAYVGFIFWISGFTGIAIGNNSVTPVGFTCTASSAGSITLTVIGGYNGFTGTPVAAQMFVGTAVDCTASPICSVTTFAFSDQASIASGMQLQWSQDNTNWDHIQRETNTAASSSIISDKVRARYFRIVYINGPVTQGYFRIQTLTSVTNTSGTVRDLDTLVNSDDEAMIVRSILTGRASPGNGYTFTDVITDIYGSLQVAIGGAAADAFGRLRIATPVTLFDSQFQYDTQPLLFQTSLVGSGTVAKTANESSLTLSTGGTTSTWGAVNQTKQYFRYEPGKSQQIVMTGVIGAKTTNVRSRIGYFDANDGVYFEQDGTDGMSINVRTSTSGSPVNSSHVLQSAWNVDKLDGTGPSGITLDWSKTQIFAIDFQWLGVGRVRWGFFANGVLIICHQLYNSNVISSPYMNTANLPCRAEIFNTGTAGGTTTMKQVCMTVVSEGGAEYPQAYQFSAVSGVGSATATPTGVRAPVVSIQPKVTFNSITNRAKFSPVTVSVLCTPGATQPVYWELVYNPTLVGATFASVAPDSMVNSDVSATGTILTVTGSTYSGSTKTITGAWTGGANNQYLGQWITLSGFTATANNGIWLCTASAAGSMDLTVAGGSNSIVGTPRAEGRGIVVQSGLAVATDAAQNAGLSSRVVMTLDITGLAPDTLSLCVTGLGAGAPGAWGSITWEEIR